MKLPEGVSAALISDLAAALRTDNISNWIEQKCQDLASLGLYRGRVEFTKRLLEAANIREIRTEARLPAAAAILPLETGGFVIAVRPTRSSRDRRFWVAHELSHTFWYQPNSNGIPLSRRQAMFRDDRTIEWLCNRAAAALLIPRLLLFENPSRHTVRLIGGDLHLLGECATQLQVPERLLARRLWHDLLDQASTIFSVEQFPDRSSRGTVTWAALPQGRGLMRKKIERRVLPLWALPELRQGETKEVVLCGRWRSFLLGSASIDRAIPFERLEGGHSEVPAKVGRWGPRWFVKTNFPQLDLHNLTSLGSV